MKKRMIKKKMVVLFLGIITVLISCKGEKKKNTIKEINSSKSIEVEIPKDNSFVVKFIAKISSDDNFRLYYSYLDETFEDERAILINVKGQEQEQEIVFNFPKKEKPEKFRIHMGRGNIDKEILLKEIRVTYNDSEIKIDKEKFKDSFNISSNFKFDVEAGVLTPIELEKGVFDPHFVSNKNLNSLLVDLY